MRAIYVPWDIALESKDTVLEGLTRYTSLNTVTLSANYISQPRGEKKTGVSRLVLPTTKAFRVGVPSVTQTMFRAMTDFMRQSKAMGFKVLCGAAPLFIRTGSESIACVDFTGKPVLREGETGVYGCPNNPEVQDYGETFLSQLIDSWSVLDFLSLDHIEYPLTVFASWPDVNLNCLFVCFCESCRTEAAGEGLDLEKVRREVESIFELLKSGAAADPNDRVKGVRPSDILSFLLNRPHLTAWLDFRMRSMTKYVQGLVRASRKASKRSNPRLKVGFFTQLPALSKLVGTDYEALYPSFDYICPKFPDYLPASIIPIIADEVARLGGWEKNSLQSTMRELLDLGPGPDRYKSLGGLRNALLYSNAFDASIIDRQMRCIKPLIGKIPIVPHIWGDSFDLPGIKKKRSVLRKNGFEEYSIWTFGEYIRGEQVKAVKGIL